MTLTYYQKVGDQSPGSGGFSFGAQNWHEVYEFNPTTNTVTDAISDILGYSQPSGKGGLTRKLPLANAQFPWLFASSVEPLGVGYTDAENNLTSIRVDVTPNLEAPTITEQYWSWCHYRLGVRFDAVPYAVLNDDSITVSTVTWTDIDGSTPTTTYANEWLRFTDFAIEIAPETAFAQQGQMVFKVNSGALPNAKTFSGFPRMMIPNSLIKFTWYAVPYSYIYSANSRFAQYVGRVNINDWYLWKKGQLLYEGVRILRRYPPPVPALSPWNGTSAVSTYKVCDLEITFRLTQRVITAAAPAATSANYVQAGHNLPPFLGGGGASRGFYYATTNDANATPIYFGFPVEILFGDPDVP